MIWTAVRVRVRVRDDLQQQLGLGLGLGMTCSSGDSGPCSSAASAAAKAHESKTTTAAWVMVSDDERLQPSERAADEWQCERARAGTQASARGSNERLPPRDQKLGD